jgi:hypothetical protein
VQEQFPANFPETPVPHRNAVRRLVEKFRETGSVLDAERIGGPSKLNDKKLMDISDSMLRSPSKSLPVSTLVDITSNIFYKCTATFRTHCKIILWDRRLIRGPSLTETSLCDAYL